MFAFVAILAAAATVVSSASVPRGRHYQSVWQASNYRSLLTFGDSYTDENRLNYFGSNNGSAPPAGTFLPESFDTAGGGRTWPRYVVQYTGSDKLLDARLPSSLSARERTRRLYSSSTIALAFALPVCSAKMAKTIRAVMQDPCAST